MIFRSNASKIKVIVFPNVSKNTLLLDVRFKEEFVAGHAENALHLSYDEILSSAAKQLEDRDALILVYCSRGKRSLQTVALFRWLGYTNVNALGGLNRLPVE